MITTTRTRVGLVLFVAVTSLLVRPPDAGANRVDITEPAVLGPLVLRGEIYVPNDYERAMVDVHFANGIYSYVYAVSSSPYFPVTGCCEAGIVSFSVAGHPLGTTWGAINGSDVSWTAFPDHPRPTLRVESITPFHDGFLVVPLGSGRYTAVYMQSPLPPRRNGTFTYTGRVVDYDDDENGIVRVESFSYDGVLAPVPEPVSFVLFGLGLAGLAAHRRLTRS